MTLINNQQSLSHKMNSPFKWVGGKSRLRKYIINLLPEHSCYVEPFCGAAWVLFGKTPSDVEVINDIDNNLITFFRVVKEKPEELIASFEWELIARAEFERLAALNIQDLTDVQIAHRFYYLIMAGWVGTQLSKISNKYLRWRARQSPYWGLKNFKIAYRTGSSKVENGYY